MDPVDFEILKFIKYHLEKETSIRVNIKNSLRYSTHILKPYSQDWYTSLEEYKNLFPGFEEKLLAYLTEFEKMNIYPKYYLRFHDLEDNILFYIETYYYSVSTSGLAAYLYTTNNKIETKLSFKQILLLNMSYYQMIKDFLINVCGIYICWILLHAIAANLYPQYCAEFTIFGIIKSAFVAPAPHCQAMRWVITNGGNIITQMWIVLGTWACGKIFIIK